MAIIENPVSPIVGHLEGLHLFHFDGAPCAQRVRFALGEKGLARGREVRFDSAAAADCAGEPGRWVSRQVSLVRKDHMTPAYAMIQPNLVVPALVHDGVLHIESMDIIEYLDRAFGGPPLVPREDPAVMADADALTGLGKALHRSIRFVTFRWGLGRLGRLSAAEEENLKTLLAGAGDGEQLVGFYQGYDSGGIPDAVFLDHLRRLFEAFGDLDMRLADGRAFLTGADVTMADVIWAMKVNRLDECGYPFARVHPAVWEWFRRIRARPSFRDGVMGHHRGMNTAFRLKSRVENLVGVGLKQAVAGLAA